MGPAQDVLRRPGLRSRPFRHRVYSQNGQQDHERVQVRALGRFDDGERIPEIDEQTVGGQVGERQKTREDEGSSQVHQNGCRLKGDWLQGVEAGDRAEIPLGYRHVGAGHMHVMGLGAEGNVQPVQLRGINGKLIRADAVHRDMTVPNIAEDIR